MQLQTYFDIDIQIKPKVERLECYTNSSQIKLPNQIYMVYDIGIHTAHHILTITKFKIREHVILFVYIGKPLFSVAHKYMASNLLAFDILVIWVIISNIDSSRLR